MFQQNSKLQLYKKCLYQWHDEPTQKSWMRTVETSTSSSINAVFVKYLQRYQAYEVGFVCTSIIIVRYFTANIFQHIMLKIRIELVRFYFQDIRVCIIFFQERYTKYSRRCQKGNNMLIGQLWNSTVCNDIALSRISRKGLKFFYVYIKRSLY